MTSPLSGLREDLIAQREFVQSRAPVYARLLDLLVDALDHGVLDVLEVAWAHRTFGAWYERPLLLLAAIRDDALREGPDHPLWEAVVGPKPSLAAATASALRAALAIDREPLWGTLAARHLQTNEGSRAVAWLWPASLSAEVSPGRPLSLFDVGASAGLNLVADHLPPRWVRPDGAPLLSDALPPVARRAGYDLRPLDVRFEEDARWLRACVWPGQDTREEVLDRAIDVLRSLPAEEAPRVETARAEEVPPRLPRVAAGEPRALAYQTVVRDYLSAAERDRYERGMRAWLRESAPGAALWIELEVLPEAREGGPPSAITAHVHGGDGAVHTLTLAYCSPHPDVIDVQEDAVRALSRRMG